MSKNEKPKGPAFFFRFYTRAMHEQAKKVAEKEHRGYLTHYLHHLLAQDIERRKAPNP